MSAELISNNIERSMSFPQVRSKAIISGEEFSRVELMDLLNFAEVLRVNRTRDMGSNLLKGKTLVLLFDKSSFRTRLSFTIAMQELGGNIVESVGSTRKSEEPEDLARVLNGYCHALMIRSHDEKYLKRMTQRLDIPLINGLTDNYHPCQILADLLTMKQRYGRWEGLTITYVGDGNNILHSLMLMAPKLGIKVNYCCPTGYGPKEAVVLRAKELVQGKGGVQSFSSPQEAVKSSHAVYTDVWTSMGFESQDSERHNAFEGFQVNEELMSLAADGACFLHCMPMVRGEEVSDTLPDSDCSVVFAQAENRLHVQKALIVAMMV